MSKEDIIDYVMTTPSNPNKTVLEGMLDSIADAGGSSAAPLIVNVSYNEADQQFYMNKTFGEIRTAFESARPVIVYDEANTTVDISSVIRIEYCVNEDYADGTVEATQSYNVSINEEPFTLEALDAKYPAYN